MTARCGLACCPLLLLLLLLTSRSSDDVIAFEGLSGNNYPLKGGKTDDFEGGTRAVSFIFGGVVPPALRGTTNNAYIHAADWYATLCGLAGVDPTDSGAVAEGVPPIDSVDQWQTILTPNATWEDGARQEMVLAYNFLNKVRAQELCCSLLVYKQQTPMRGGC